MRIGDGNAGCGAKESACIELGWGEGMLFDDSSFVLLGGEVE